MATSESPARLSRKVTKHEEDLQVHGDEIVKILRTLKRHTADLSRIDSAVSSIDSTVSSIDSTVSSMDSRVDKLEVGQTSLSLDVGLLRSDVKTVDGRLVKVERSMSRHEEMLEEVLRRLEPRSG